MKNKVIYLVFCLVIVSGQLLSQNIKLVDGLKTTFEITQSDYEGFVVNSSISEFQHIPINSNIGEYSLFNAEGYGHSMVEGSPKLPVLKRIIEVPLGAKIIVNIINASYSEYDLADFSIYDQIFPAQPPMNSISIWRLLQTFILFNTGLY